MATQENVAVCAMYIQEGIMSNPDVNYVALLNCCETHNIYIEKQVSFHAILCAETLENKKLFLSTHRNGYKSSFEYDVCNPLGGWLAAQLWFNPRHQAPSQTEAKKKLHELIVRHMKVEAYAD
ncbi:hypothetical protein [Chromobacterium amazonense]|uniref:Uncharacterized protein n=1 Tax=Chromobacterium amazonense TaxID=1382803 RepID=A0ABU8V1R6_9NEIS|nr:hypothetical protein [Chromobacterium amazonense]MBM2885026.1 hypothetical protein [Chromobacterium amazonense]MDE1716019.1 hypothetical protein [Chromobacterium amazonense]MDQ4541456.1 hypothetical protein [Chromobacterium amazonense]